MKITEYADILNIDIKLNYYHNQGDRWTASFDRAETKPDPEHAILSGEYGQGTSADKAISNYIAKIIGKVLVIDAGSSTKRREYIVPESLTL